MSYEVTILGCGSATPTSKQNPTAQLIKMQERFFLVDCGEGTQQQLRIARAKFTRINHIFISHLHGDHFFGLPGLLSSFHLLNRTTPLHVYGPPELKHWLDHTFAYTNTKLVYPLVFHATQDKEKELLFEDDKVKVYSFPLKHSITTTGFLFLEKEKERNIIKEKIKEYSIEVCDIQNIKNGRDWIAPNGNVISNTELTTPPKASLSYAFCSDTAYAPNLVEYLPSVNLLYHESTFLHEDIRLAQKTKHSTALQAAEIAKKTQSQNLLLGHYSVRYDDKQPFAEEASPLIRNVYLANDLNRYTVTEHAVHCEELGQKKKAW